ncbi:hypothetical protein ES703_120729 [subsurface metagenome]
MKNKWLGLVIALFLTLSLIAISVVVGCPAPDEAPPPEGELPEPTYQWVIGEPFPEGFLIYDATQEFIKMMGDASDGRMKFTIYPGTLLGSYIDQIIAVGRGEQDFTLSWASAASIPRSDFIWLGYMYRDWDDFEQAWMPGGWMQEMLPEIEIEDANVLPLGSMPTSLTGITSKVKLDPMATDKNCKIRVPPSPVLVAGYQAQGFDPVSIDMSEVESALLLGTIDACGYISSAQFWEYTRAMHSPLRFLNLSILEARLLKPR